jgi:hypothetical protein
VDALQLRAHSNAPDGEPYECARHVVALLRANHVVTDLRYNPDVHDGAIMEAEAVPILQLNRLRLLSADANQCLPVFLGSALVRRHPMMTYHLLRSSAETLALHLIKEASPSSGRIWDGRIRKRHRPPS